MIPGKKVRLRAIREDDLKNMITWLNNPVVTRHLAAMRPWSVVEEKAWIERAMRNEDPTTISLVIESADNEYLGAVGLVHIDTRNRSAEVGIVIARPDDWGKGYGTEAMVLMLRHAFEELNLHRVMLKVHAYNERAIASYLGVGFVEEGRQRESHFRHGSWHDTVVMGILQEEYFARHGRTEDGLVRDLAPKT
jgi:RimJ/RimL family protein N-acetyltransferase